MENRHLFSVPALAGILLLAVLLLGGCRKAERRNLGSGAPARPVAVVNNERITLEEFFNTYQLFLTRWDRFIQKDPEKKEELKEIVLANMIDKKLMDQEVRRKGLEAEDAAVDAEIQRLTSPYERDDLARAVGQSHRTLQQWRVEFRRRMLHEHLIEREVVARIRVTQREMRAYYERNRSRFETKEQVRARHLAVSNRSDYRKVVRALRRNADFIELVRKYSITPDRLRDGDLGFVERGVLPPEFDQAIFKLPRVGSINPTNKPVKTQIGYHLFRLEGRKPSANLTFKEAVPMIRGILTEEKQPVAFQAWIQALRDRATIRINRKLLAAGMG